MLAQMVHYYKNVRRTLAIETMTYEIIKSYDDHFVLMKAIKKDQDKRLAKV